MNYVELWRILRNRFPEREYALLQEVRDGAGFSSSRSADGIAMNLWPSRGLEIHGIEVKRHRQDWLNELKKPEKADAVFKFCDRWWIVAVGSDVVKKAEVPKTWGLLVVKNAKVYTEIEAPPLKPIPLTRSFIAAMMKRATSGVIRKESIEAEIETARKQGMDHSKAEVDRLQKDIGALKMKVLQFENASGVKILYAWDGDIGSIGKAVQAILSKEEGGFKGELQGLQRAATRIGQEIGEVLKELEKK